MLNYCVSLFYKTSFFPASMRLFMKQKYNHFCFVNVIKILVLIKIGYFQSQECCGRSQIFKNKRKGVGCKLVMLTSHMQANVWQTYHLDTNLSAT